MELLARSLSLTVVPNTRPAQKGIMTGYGVTLTSGTEAKKPGVTVFTRNEGLSSSTT